jgi:hypothetical protein
VGGLLKHHLKALKLPVMQAGCEKIAQRCAGDNADHRAFRIESIAIASW